MKSTIGRVTLAIAASVASMGYFMYHHLSWALSISWVQRRYTVLIALGAFAFLVGVGVYSLVSGEGKGGNKP